MYSWIDSLGKKIERYLEREKKIKQKRRNK